MTNDPRTESIAPGPTLRLDEIEAAAAVHAQLAEAQVLLAETRVRCRNLLAAAQNEANDILEAARATGQRIIADARGQVTGVDMRTRESAAFSDLWEATEDDIAVEGFFLTIPERTEGDVFNA